jgi:hypothetical protein
VEVDQVEPLRADHDVVAGGALVGRVARLHDVGGRLAEAARRGGAGRRRQGEGDEEEQGGRDECVDAHGSPLSDAAIGRWRSPPRR